MKTLSLVILVVAAGIVARSAHVSAQEQTREERDRSLLESFRSGKRGAPAFFYRIHRNPTAGQLGTYRNSNGLEQTLRVASVNDKVCIVEERLWDSNVVLAVEFEVEGMIANHVRRAWVGRLGDKPFALAKVPPASTSGGGVGLRGRTETTEQEFKDFEQGGMRWNGRVETVKFFDPRSPDGKPSAVTRTWIVDNEWFRHSIRCEEEAEGKSVTVWEMTRAASQSEPLLDWTDVSPLSTEAERELRKPFVDAANRENRKLMRSGRLSYRQISRLHPAARVGDWAEYGHTRVVLALLKKGRAIIEVSRTDPDERLVAAWELDMTEGSTEGIVAAYVGMKGERPEAHDLPTELNSTREAETSASEPREVELAGRKWIARDVRAVRKSKSPRGSDRIIESLLADDQPFGEPLRVNAYWAGREASADLIELTATGASANAALDWSGWRPAPKWEAPFTADQVKAFIKVGMTWKMKQEREFGKNDIRVSHQEYRVTRVDENGFEVEAVVTRDNGEKATYTSYDKWDVRIELINGVSKDSRLRAVERKLQLADREIDVVVYHWHMFGHAKVYALSRELPGVRVCTEEKLDVPSKVWLTDIQFPK